MGNSTASGPASLTKVFPEGIENTCMLSFRTTRSECLRREAGRVTDRREPSGMSVGLLFSNIWLSEKQLMVSALLRSHNL